MATKRKITFLNQNYYHIFNRGVERRSVFTTKWELQRALNTLKYYRFLNLPMRLSKFLDKTVQEQEDILYSLNNSNKKIVEVIAYCLMPNHFHFLLKQVEEGGIAQFTSNFTNSYTKYFNTKHQRNGPLFQGTFKAVIVETDEQLIHLSRYIHLNPISSSILSEKDIRNFYWSSFREYINLDPSQICSKQIVLDFFSSIDKYKEFVQDQITYAKELEKIKHLIIDD